MLQPGQKAPTVSLYNKEGQEVSLADFKGKHVVLYFYPKDDTPGCTKEACNFRDANREIQKMGVQIIGVSRDSYRSHEKFSKKYSLPFTLWSDPDHKLMESFGVWQKKKFMGREYMGTVRSTFLIDPKGVIVYVWDKVHPKDHTEEVLAVLKTIVVK